MALTEQDLKYISDSGELTMRKLLDETNDATTKAIGLAIKTHVVTCPYGKWFANRKAFAAGMMLGVAIVVGGVVVVALKLFGK